MQATRLLGRREKKYMGANQNKVIIRLEIKCRRFTSQEIDLLEESESSKTEVGGKNMMYTNQNSYESVQLRTGSSSVFDFTDGETHHYVDPFNVIENTRRG